MLPQKTRSTNGSSAGSKDASAAPSPLVVHDPMLLLLLPGVICVTRFQSQLPDQKHYTRVFPALATIWREEGPRALYKGFVPKALRLGIGQSVGLVTFQQLLRAFGVEAPKDPTEPEYIPVPWE